MAEYKGAWAGALSLHLFSSLSVLWQGPTLPVHGSKLNQLILFFFITSSFFSLLPFFFPSFTAPLSGAMCRCVAPCCIRSWEMQSWLICPIILLQFSFMVLMSSSLQRSAPIISMRQYTSEWCTSDVYHYSSIIFPWAGTAVAVKTSESSVSSLCTHGSAHRTSSNRHTRT